MPSIRFISTAISFITLYQQIRSLVASSLQDDPVTTCRSDTAKLEEYFGVKLETKLKNLPTSAIHHPSPWNGPSWLVYQDSINYEWKKGQLSPAEKYATAFGLNVTEFMDKVSAQNGIDSEMNYSTPCTTDNDCDFTTCAIRKNAISGYCIPTWYGISHAWAPASVLEKGPVCAVNFNGVIFHPIDVMGRRQSIDYLYWVSLQRW
ncbi:hypothetical protein F443_21430 [Phytophthora nicotianae P1569]|uniref:Uncharacterized protein n=1 Tax=Phytophthora nicotianae P1569 TaxID=1317065 RepID=V9DXS0_PHYNI|nr:hypothetical protein F443_21430 [Phytophthora nicotianae P1569]